MRARRLIKQGDRVLVAVSGGVDSVVLLDLLRHRADQLGIDVHAAHFDHGMREDSAADAEWVAGLCRAWEIPLIRGRATRDLRGETDARIERYRFLHDAMRASGATRIATAHHADDQVETVLFRLLRGTGMRGLAGIPLKRGPFIRPLLPFFKAAVLDYARRRGIAHREDPTNVQLEFLRNRIRKNVIPALETVRPSAARAILSLARHAARTESAWRSLLQRIATEVISRSESGSIELARDMLLEYHPELRARVLRHVLRQFGVVPGRAHTRQLLGFCEKAESGSSVDVGKRVRIERNFDTIRIARKEAADFSSGSVTIAGARGRGELQLGGSDYDVEWNVADEQAAGAESFAPVDTDLELRGWRAGDRIRLPYGTKKLKKLFAERRIPAAERARIPVLSDQHGRVLWVVGIARSIDALPADAGQVLNITVQNAESR